MLANGVLVGELVFLNIGDSPCGFGGVMSLDRDLFFELERPDGKISVLKQIKDPRKSSMSVQGARLDPGDYAIAPICLLKINGEYIFAEEGRYRIRAKFGDRAIPLQDETGKTWPVFKLQSIWVEFKVKPIGRGRPKYANSHPEKNAYRAFHFGDRAIEIQKQLSSYREYQHEQEKFVVYQSLGVDLIRVILGVKENRLEFVGEAKRARAFAYQVGVGEEMWEWIVGELEAIPVNSRKAKAGVVKNGYYF